MSWTPETLKQYVDALFAEREHHFQDQMTSADRAVAKAEEALDRRLESMNELRESLAEAQRRFATKDELATLRRELTTRLDMLLDPQTGIYAQLGGSNSGLRTWAIALLTAIVLLLLGLIAHIASTGGKFF